MIVPAIVIGAVIYAIMAEKKIGKTPDGGVRFEQQCGRLIVTDQPRAEKLFGESIVRAVSAGITEPEDVLYAYLRKYAPSCAANVLKGFASREQAALYLVLLDGTIDTMYETGVLTEDEAYAAVDRLYGYMETYDITLEYLQEYVLQMIEDRQDQPGAIEGRRMPRRRRSRASRWAVA